MNKAFLLTAMLFLVFIPFTNASQVSRSFSTPAYANQNVTIYLTVNVTNGEQYYLVDEMYPAGFTALSGDPQASLQQAFHVKWAIIQGASNTTLFYVLKSPNATGNYTFVGGEYMFENDTLPNTIMGQNTISVIQAPAQVINITSIFAGSTYSKTFNISTAGINFLSCYNFSNYITGRCDFLFRCGMILPSNCDNPSCAKSYNCTEIMQLSNPERVSIDYTTKVEDINNVFAIAVFLTGTNMTYDFQNQRWITTNFIVESSKMNDTIKVIGATQPTAPSDPLGSIWITLMLWVKSFMCVLGFCSP